MGWTTSARTRKNVSSGICNRSKRSSVTHQSWGQSGFRSRCCHISTTKPNPSSPLSDVAKSFALNTREKNSYSSSRPYSVTLLRISSSAM